MAYEGDTGKAFLFTHHKKDFMNLFKSKVVLNFSYNFLQANWFVKQGPVTVPAHDF